MRDVYEGRLCEMTNIPVANDGKPSGIYPLPVANYDDCLLHVQWDGLGVDEFVNFWIEQQIVRKGPWVGPHIGRIVNEEKSSGHRDTRVVCPAAKRTADFALVLDTTRMNALRVMVERGGEIHPDLPGRLDIWFRLASDRELPRSVSSKPTLEWSAGDDGGCHLGCWAASRNSGPYVLSDSSWCGVLCRTVKLGDPCPVERMKRALGK